MRLIQATVKFQSRNVNTRYGEKSNAVFILTDGDEVTVWGPADHAPLFNLVKGQSVTLGLNSGGKYSLVESPTAPTKTEIKVSCPNALQTYLDEQATLYRDCFLTASNAMAGLIDSEEGFRAVATTLFIQAQKEYPNLKARVQEFKHSPELPMISRPRPTVVNGRSID
ncbi:hypothetical protein RIF25_09225 [Thermosynechococcaceae cyanobacterium BACA0444]|uniref:Uncharacterized protein n=1 Tax=Pseudocalidococcus azoricus BACA0444 TaxID=2918990 RepID=A0AAE4FRL0_9CYAN|nr:hypothetical protein [Pseudocalidococcus azoricus]MDS3860989.1 hypothetical protein [Pseudocalidococcus azoricus BACA0444]